MNSPDVKLFKQKGNQWVPEQQILGEHTQRVMAIDWAPKTNRILTCAADRNAYVWTYEDNVWKPVLVILRIDRAATCCKWSPNENKFAVGSGQKLVAVCFFDPENNWWSSRHIKKGFKSTVTSIDWHPNNQLLACGATDFRARVYNAYMKEVDGKAMAETSWGTGADLKAADDEGGAEEKKASGKPAKAGFGTLVAEFNNSYGGWVHSVSFNADGTVLAWVSHDSCLSVADSSLQKKVFTARWTGLPFTNVIWIAPDSLLATGHDYHPVLFKYKKGDAVQLGGRLVSGRGQQATKLTGKLDQWRLRDQKAIESSEAAADSSFAPDANYVHNNLITELAIHSGTRSACSKFVTVGLDGRLVLWDTQACLPK